MSEKNKSPLRIVEGIWRSWFPNRRHVMFRLHTVCCMHALWYAATLYVYSFYTMIDLFMLSSLHHIFMLRPWLPFLISEWLHRSAALPAAPCCGRRATFPWQTAAPRRRRPQQRRPRHLGENGKNQGFWNWNQRKDGKVKQNNFAWLFCVLICFFWSLNIPVPSIYHYFLLVLLFSRVDW